MREISPVLTPELERHAGSVGITKTPAYPLATFRELLEHCARLSYLNKDHLLFYRGQARDYLNKAGASSFYPSIYREDNLKREEVSLRFRRLERAAERLRSLFTKGKIEGHPDLARRRLVQWSVLQHYEVAQTPLLDLTHSQRVACSIATEKAVDGEAFVYVFGLPYVTNRISLNSEQDTVLVRLLSICPPSALRPYFQEGYLAGTSDVTDDYADKSELDLNRRLVAKFAVPTHERFWGHGLRALSYQELFPSSDGMKELCDQILLDEQTDIPEPGVQALGEFVAKWAGFERLLMKTAQRHEDRVLSIGEAIRSLHKQELLEPWSAAEVDALRRFRNNVVHGHERVPDERLRAASETIGTIRRQLEREVRNRKRGR